MKSGPKKNNQLERKQYVVSKRHSAAIHTMADAQCVSDSSLVRRIFDKAFGFEMNFGSGLTNDDLPNRK